MTGPHGEFSIGGDLWPGLSKLIEECGEVIQVGGKLIGNEGRADHWDGSHLPTRLEEELADLQAAMLFFIRRNNLSLGRIDERVVTKLALFEQWHRETQARRSAA
jgi:NTP pyrophosphatase (non-canonical NTP hydrolase)